MNNPFLIIFACISFSYLEFSCNSSQNSHDNTKKTLVRKLDSIYIEDQKHRRKIDSISRIYGFDSDEIARLLKNIKTTDSSNLIMVTSILDSAGWLGAGIIGEKANAALFLVIQHADLPIQRKYLPLIRRAFKEGTASGEQLAQLEDRVSLALGEKQIYGTQIMLDESGKFYIPPIKDEKNVNTRRTLMGLEPLEDYVKNWGIEYTLPK